MLKACMSNVYGQIRGNEFDLDRIHYHCFLMKIQIKLIVLNTNKL